MSVCDIGWRRYMESIIPKRPTGALSSGRPSKLSPEGHVRLREIAAIRVMDTPNKTLARELNASERTVVYWVQRYMRELTVPRETGSTQNERKDQ